MVPWAYVMDDLTQTIKKTKEDGGLGHTDPLSMREITAMADYNLARSKNVFGSLKNAYDQRRTENRNVPMHMMPDYRLWLKHAQPDVYYHLYGPDPVPPEEFIREHTLPKARTRDTRSRNERRSDSNVVLATKAVGPKIPPVDDQGRIRHHHTYEQPPEQEHTHRVHAGGLHERRQHQIRPQPSTANRSDAAQGIAKKALEAAEKRRRAAAGS